MKQENAQLHKNTSTPVVAEETNSEPSTNQSAAPQQNTVENDDSINDSFFANFDD